jgi:hypothetical protein
MVIGAAFENINSAFAPGHTRWLIQLFSMWEVVVPMFERLDGSLAGDLAFAEFFEPHFGVLGKRLMPEGGLVNGELNSNSLELFAICKLALAVVACARFACLFCAAEN